MIADAVAFNLAWTEADLQGFVMRTARLLGYAVHHTRFALGSDAGYPDLTMVNPRQGRTLFAELKREGKSPTLGKTVRSGRGLRRIRGQADWLLDLLTAEQEAYWWVPSDAPDIVEILRSGPRRDMACLRRLREFLRETERGR